MRRPTTSAVTSTALAANSADAAPLQPRAGGEGVVDEQDAMAIDPARWSDDVIAGDVVADLTEAAERSSLTADSSAASGNRPSRVAPGRVASPPPPDRPNFKIIPQDFQDRPTDSHKCAELM
jgi:hypothetical protein